MGKQTLKEKIVAYIGHIGWKLFCWSYDGGESQYLLYVYEDAKRRGYEDLTHF